MTVEEIEDSLREKCWSCKGSGAEPDYTSEPTWCNMCVGTGLQYYYDLLTDSDEFKAAEAKAAANEAARIALPWKL